MKPDARADRKNRANGDIILANADCAEEFDVAEDTVVDPGGVTVVGEDRRVRVSYRPYDKRVADGPSLSQARSAAR
jgi:hypothetical protein